MIWILLIKDLVCLMRSNVMTISDLGLVSISSAPIQMTIYEIAELFDVLVPTVRARVNTILKSKSVTPHTIGNGLGSCNAPIFFDLEVVNFASLVFLLVARRSSNKFDYALAPQRRL